VGRSKPNGKGVMIVSDRTMDALVKSFQTIEQACAKIADLKERDATACQIIPELRAEIERLKAEDACRCFQCGGPVISGSCMNAHCGEPQSVEMKSADERMETEHEQFRKLCEVLGTDAGVVGYAMRAIAERDKEIEKLHMGDHVTGPATTVWGQKMVARNNELHKRITTKDKRIEELEELVAGVINLLEAGDLSRDSQCHIARDLRNEILPTQSPEEEQ